MELRMREWSHDNEVPINVKMLMNDLEFIDNQIRAIKADIKYVMKLIESFDKELQFARSEALCPQ